MVTSLMIVGVGGQGTLLAARLLGNLLLREGLDVKLSEVHGMSQRGGSVVTYVRYGGQGEVHSPLVSPGEADVILSFEKLEAARYAPYLRAGGLIVTNNREIDPMPVVTGAAAYPHNALTRLREHGVRVRDLDATDLALRAGSAKAVNIVLLGYLSREFPFSRESWERALEQTVSEKFLEINKKAFALGAAQP